MSLLSLLINLTHPWWIKVLFVWVDPAPETCARGVWPPDSLWPSESVRVRSRPPASPDIGPQRPEDWRRESALRIREELYYRADDSTELQEIVRRGQKASSWPVYSCLICNEVTLEHKTSHKGQFYEIEIYTSYESWFPLMYGLLW